MSEVAVKTEDQQLHQDADWRYRESRKVTLVGSVVDLVLGVAKIFAGVYGSSQALVADGIHSLSDLLTDLLVLLAVKHASRGADEDHPYGHARIETVMTVVLGAALILVGVGIAYDAVRRLLDPSILLHPGWMALVVAAVSILAKEVIYHYTLNAAIRLRSNLLRANAWHSRSDAISSVVVVVGVIGVMAGFSYLDAMAAVGVAIMVSKIGWDLAWNSIRELVDTGLADEQVEVIRDNIRSVGGVRDLHLLRTRQMGGDALVDVHIQVDPKLSVSEGHQVSELVRQCLIGNVDEVSDVLVHIDPENDGVGDINSHLPTRDELLEKLKDRWQGIGHVDQIQRITLHYLGGRVHVEVSLPLSEFEDIESAKEIGRQLKQAGSQLEEVGDVQVLFC